MWGWGGLFLPLLLNTSPQPQKLASSLYQPKEYDIWHFLGLSKARSGKEGKGNMVLHPDLPDFSHYDSLLQTQTFKKSP